MKLRTLFALSFLIFFSCSSTKNIKENKTSESKLNGITKEFYPNGDLKVEWNYKKGKLHGKTIEYFENGNVKSILNY